MSYDTASGPTLWEPPDTSAPELDQRAHRALLVDLLTTQVGENRVFDYGQVPGLDGNDGDPPAIYVILTIGRRYVGPRRAGRSGRSGWRVTTRYVGRTPDEARWAQARVTLAFEETRLLVGESWSTPVMFEDEDELVPDQGYYSGFAMWTYAL